MKQVFNRKEFLKSAGKASCALMAAGTVASLFESCATVPVIKVQPDTTGKIYLPLSEFADKPVRIVRTEKIPYDILVAKQPDGSFSAMLMRCTHQDWALTAGSKGLYCSLHGSAFDFTGKVTNGPALGPLKKFNVIQTSNQLIIS